MADFKLLDVYCGVGGSAKGYEQAGFKAENIVGVDYYPMPNFPYTFVEGVHAVEYIREHGHTFDFIHASPPCQAYSWAAKRWKKVIRRDLVKPTRDALIATGKPYVIENVAAAPLINPIRLCGLMFGATATLEHPKILRHRIFESNIPLIEPVHVKHISGGVLQGFYVTVAGHGGNNAKGNYQTECNGRICNRCPQTGRSGRFLIPYKTIGRSRYYSG